MNKANKQQSRSQPTPASNGTKHPGPSSPKHQMSMGYPFVSTGSLVRAPPGKSPHMMGTLRPQHSQTRPSAAPLYINMGNPPLRYLSQHPSQPPSQMQMAPHMSYPVGVRMFDPQNHRLGSYTLPRHPPSAGHSQATQMRPFAIPPSGPFLTQSLPYHGKPFLRPGNPLPGHFVEQPQHAPKQTTPHQHHVTCTCPPELHQAVYEHTLKRFPPSGPVGAGGIPATSKVVPSAEDDAKITSFLSHYLGNSSSRGNPTLQQQPSIGRESPTGDQAMEDNPSSEIIFPVPSFEQVQQMESRLMQLSQLVHALHTQNRQLLAQQQQFQMQHPPATRSIEDGGPRRGESDPGNNTDPATSDSSLDSAISATSSGSECSKSTTTTLREATGTVGENCLEKAVKEVAEVRVQLEILKEMEMNNAMERQKELLHLVHLVWRQMEEYQSIFGNSFLLRERAQMDAVLSQHEENCARLTSQLHELECLSEDLREDLLRRRCTVNPSEMEMVGYHLLNLSRELAGYKIQFPSLQSKLKALLHSEIEVIQRNQNFMETEGKRLEEYLLRCKKLSSTLNSIKRMAVKGATAAFPEAPNGRSSKKPTSSSPEVDGDNQRRLLMESIRALRPNHDERMQRIAKYGHLRAQRLSLQRGVSSTADNEGSNSVNATNQPRIVRVEETATSFCGDATEDSTVTANVNFEFPPATVEPSQYLWHQNFIFSDTGTPINAVGPPIVNKTFGGSFEEGSTCPLRHLGTLAPALQPPGRNPKVVFSDTVIVEDGTEYLSINCLDEFYQEQQLQHNLTSSTAVPLSKQSRSLSKEDSTKPSTKGPLLLASGQTTKQPSIHALPSPSEHDVWQKQRQQSKLLSLSSSSSDSKPSSTTVPSSIGGLVDTSPKYKLTSQTTAIDP